MKQQTMTLMSRNRVATPTHNNPQFPGEMQEDSPSWGENLPDDQDYDSDSRLWGPDSETGVTVEKAYKRSPHSGEFDRLEGSFWKIVNPRLQIEPTPKAAIGEVNAYVPTSARVSPMLGSTGSINAPTVNDSVQTTHLSPAELDRVASISFRVGLSLAVVVIAVLWGYFAGSLPGPALGGGLVAAAFSLFSLTLWHQLRQGNGQTN